ncbi:MAG: DUF523 domain-containing protein [Candidatus Riflebacteria bacterium]|nr:DUF523 domain-containing protein [Candidatus Riflebacteria bacterium]
MVSACLLGVNCNYKGGCSYNFAKDSRFWAKLSSKYFIIPICPEQQGGLPTPRIPSELLNKAEDIELGKGKIISKEGLDVTPNFVKGAEEIVRIARMYSVQFAVLKSKSPSCGVKSVYDGTFSGVLIDGQGYTAYLLNKSGITLYDENDFCDILKCTISDFKV